MSKSQNLSSKNDSSEKETFDEYVERLAETGLIRRTPLTLHEMKIKGLLLDYLEGNIQGFPDTKFKLENVARAWAKFMSLEPYHVQFDPQVEPYMTEEDKAPYLRKEGIIPGVWLLETVRDSFDWMPTPVVARELYCDAGFPPLDGLTMDKLPAVALARRAKQEGRE